MNTIDEFIASQPYAATTIRTYTDILTRLLTEITDPGSLTAAGLLDFVRKPEWGNSRQCVALAASQKYIRWKYGQTHPALSARLKRTVGNPQRALSKDDAIKLLASFDTLTPKGVRDLAICSLALDTGLRCAELCRLQIPYVDLEHCNLQVIIKGGQWEAAVYTPETAQNIRQWLVYRKTVNGPGYLFQNIQTGAKLTPEGLYSIVDNWGKTIGVKLSPHDLRRSFACLSTEVMGAPERILMIGGRWGNSDMINRYTRTLKLEAMRQYLPTAGLTKHT